MDDKPVAEIYSRDRKKRVVIYRRESGTYYYEQQYFSEDEYEMCWVPLRQHPIGLYESQDTATREAQGNIDWLMTEARQGVA